MNIHYGVERITPLRHGVVTSGTFDGVHVGHQKILHRLQEITKQTPDAESIVITFWPHPRFILYPEQTDLKLLNSIEEKIERLRDYHIDHFVIMKFSQEFAQWSSTKFIQDILLDKLNTKQLVIGYDHRFGRNREGSFDYLKNNEGKYGFTVEEIPRHDLENAGISSTKIRYALKKGNIKTANLYLGTNYQITGTVVRGKKIGREIGYPTANLKPIHDFKIVPAEGVYAVYVFCEDRLRKGMLYIGNRNTLGENLERSIEVNIFDFNQDIYHEDITIYFVDRIRDNCKFENLLELKHQLSLDQRKALQVLTHDTTPRNVKAEF